MIGLSFFLYRSLLAVPFLLPICILYVKGKQKQEAEQKKKELRMQFKDAILSWSVSLKSGYSVENAFRQVYEDMIFLYGKEGSFCQEIHAMILGMESNLTLEKMWKDFGERSGVEEIREFAEVFAAAKRSGGNLTEIIEKSVSVIAGKIETEREIEVLLSARKLEQKIMNMVPFGILIYLSITSKGYFDSLYGNAAGIAIMSICLLVYLSAVYLSNKIIHIEI